MSKIAWGRPSERFYEMGVDRGVVYAQDGSVAPWNGLIAVREEPHGGELQPYFFDGDIYHNYAPPTSYKATVEAYTYPQILEPSMGYESTASGLLYPDQERTTFNFAYRTMIGNATGVVECKIHLISNASLSATSYEYGTINDSPEGTPLSWEMRGLPVPIPGRRATAHLILDSRRINRVAFATLEAYLFGAPGILPRWLSPSQIDSYIANWPSALYVDTPVSYLGDYNELPTNPDKGAMVSIDGYPWIWDGVDWVSYPTKIPTL